MPSKSAKQARFMRAVAHNPKFAKKAGVPQSVGREYVNADKRAGKYAGGGKVKKIRDSFKYNLDREATLEEMKRFERLMDENPGVDRLVDLDTLVRGTVGDEPLINLDPNEYLNLALLVAPNYKKIFRTETNLLGKKINSRDKMVSLPGLGIDYDYPNIDSVMRVTSHDGRHRAQLLGDKGYKVPTELFDDTGGIEVSRSSFLDKLNDILLMPEREGKQKQRLPIPLRKRPFADGGSVDDYELEEMLRRSDEGMGGFEQFIPSSDVMHYLKKGLATNIGDIDEKGHLKASLRGFGDSVLSLGALPALLDVVLPRAPFKGSDWVPDWAWKADERKGKVRERIRELTRKHGDAPVMDAIGEMVTQVPVPINALKGAKFLKTAPKVAKPVIKVGGSTLEYLSPTVDPTLGNYMKGSAAGSVFNELTDEDVESELERIMREAEDLPQPKRGGMADWSYRDYAGGGKVTKRLGKLLASHRDNDGYTVEIRKGAVDNVGGAILRHRARKGTHYIVSPDGERVKAGYWMDFPEKEWLLTDEAYRAMLPEERAALEARQQATAYNPLKIQFESRKNNVMEPRIKKAGGGKVTKTANAIRALKDAISHINNKDRTSAIRALTSSGIHDDPDIQEVMRLLRGPPQAQSKARATMDRVIGEDTDSTIMPLMGP